MFPSQPESGSTAFRVSLLGTWGKHWPWMECGTSDVERGAALGLSWAWQQGEGQAWTACRGVSIREGVSYCSQQKERGGQKLLSPPLAAVFCVFGGLVARTACSLVLALGFWAWEVPHSSPFISAASFPKGKGTSINYLFRAGGCGSWEAGGCWLGGAGRGQQR